MSDSAEYRRQRRGNAKQWIGWYREDIAKERESIAFYERVKRRFPDNKEVQETADALIDLAWKRISRLNYQIKEKIKGV